MSTGAIIAVAVAVLVILAVVLVVSTARRTDARRGEGVLSRETVQRDSSARDREPVAVGAVVGGREVEAAARGTEVVKASPLAPAPYVPPDPETLGVTRRQFFNRGMVVLMSLGLAGFGAAVLGFLWSAPRGGFGGKINAGKLDDIKALIQANKNFLYVPEARAWLVEYPSSALPKAEAIYSGAVLSGMEEGLVALYQKCPHLGCRVPKCDTSQWFECPCHGSQYNRAGEKKAGPAPRGMDRFGIQVTASSDVVIDTGLVVQGPAIGVNTTGQEAEGPHCITGGH